MTKRTAEQWEALLDGTTEWPWRAGIEGIDGPGYAEVLAAETETRGSGYMTYEVPLLAGDRLDRDLPLAAAAPEAVAEVIRLRRGIDEIRQFVERFPLIPPLVETGSTEDRAYEMQEIVSHALTYILEGEA